MIDQLVRDLRLGVSTSALQRHQLAAESWLTPNEAIRLYNQAFTFAPDTAQWLGAIRRLIDAHDPAAARFERQVLDPSVMLFGDPSIPLSEKTLVVALTAVVGGLLLPVPIILNHLPSRSVDIAVITDANRCYFLLGIGPAGDDFVAMLRWMETAMRFADYERVVTLGTSMGGLSALRVALVLGLDRGVSVGGRWQWQPRRLLDPTRRHAPAFDPLCDCWAGTATRLICVHPRSHPEDSFAIDRLAKILPIERIALDSKEHNLFYSLAKSGEFRHFLDRTLGLQRGEPAGGAA